VAHKLLIMLCFKASGAQASHHVMFQAVRARQLYLLLYSKVLKTLLPTLDSYNNSQLYHVHNEIKIYQ